MREQKNICCKFIIWFWIKWDSWVSVSRKKHSVELSFIFMTGLESCENIWIFPSINKTCSNSVKSIEITILYCETLPTYCNILPYCTNIILLASNSRKKIFIDGHRFCRLSAENLMVTHSGISKIYYCWDWCSPTFRPN